MSEKNKKKNIDSKLQKIIDEGIKEWKIIENSCKSAYFISSPESQLDKLMNGK